MKTDATKKIPGEGFKRAWPPLIKMDEAVKAKINSFFKIQNNLGDETVALRYLNADVENFHL
jgi:hypothetical protein